MWHKRYFLPANFRVAHDGELKSAWRSDRLLKWVDLNERTCCAAHANFQ